MLLLLLLPDGVWLCAGKSLLTFPGSQWQQPCTHSAQLPLTLYNMHSENITTLHKTQHFIELLSCTNHTAHCRSWTVHRTHCTGAGMANGLRQAAGHTNNTQLAHAGHSCLTQAAKMIIRTSRDLGVSVLREWILEVREVKSEMKIWFTHFENEK